MVLIIYIFDFWPFFYVGTTHGTWPTSAGYYPATSCNYVAGGNGMNGSTSADSMYHSHHHSHQQANGSYSPQGSSTTADHHSLGWSKSNKDVTAAATWSPDNYS